MAKKDCVTDDDICKARRECGSCPGEKQKPDPVPVPPKKKKPKKKKDKEAETEKARDRVAEKFVLYGYLGIVLLFAGFCVWPR
jgi:hypothetical protein